MRLDPQPWMSARATVAVVDALTAKGAQVRFVGGCVRDALIGRPVKDIDIATHYPPEIVIGLLAEAGIEARPTGIEHGTVTAIVGLEHIEITTLRVDVETFGRHARVAFTDDWAEDAARRDLTINAIFCAPDGLIYDPFDGVSDLRQGRIRFVGPPESRIREDHLRLLRFFRFYAHYGSGAPDPEAIEACRATAPALATLSGERIAGELFKLLSAPDPAPVAAMMCKLGILKEIDPSLSDVERLAALVAVESLSPPADPLRRLAALLAGGVPAAERLGERLKLANRERETLELLGANEPAVSALMSPAACRRALYQIGAARFRDRVLIAWAAALGDLPAAAALKGSRFRPMLDEAQRWHAPILPIKGRDVLNRGLVPGPEVGRLMERLEAWWIEGDFTATRDDCLAWIEREILKVK